MNLRSPKRQETPYVGKFYRALRLPTTVDPEKAETLYEHGVLTITFPKAEEKKAKRLEIHAA